MTLIRDGSPVRPWCEAVLLASDLAVTALHCVDGLPAEKLDLEAWNDLGTSEVFPVQEIFEDAEAGTALLLLEREAWPDVPAIEQTAAEGCGLEIRYHEPRVDGGALAMVTTTGCADPTGRIVLDAPLVTCHSPAGAGVYRGDALVGIVESGEAGWEDGSPCVRTLTLSVLGTH